MNLCLFDLDETLLPIDSDHAWGDFVTRLGWVDGAAFRSGNDAFFAQYQAGCLDIHGYIAFATGPLRSRSADELAGAHARFMDEVIRPQIRPAALQLVDTHRRLGDELLMVTATNDFVTAPIARAFGIDHLLATRLERDARGTITGRIDGTPNYREGKLARVNEWLAARGTDWPSCGRITVYSDSVNDLPLLEAATEPVVTNAGAALETIATQRGWRLLKLFS